jgi:hypothetical protein
LHHVRIRDQPPTSITAGSTHELALNVTLHDEFDNVCTLDSTSVVQLSIAPGFNTGGATLSGTTTATAVTGMASFPRGSLSLDKVGSGYRLQASVASGTITLNTDSFVVQGLCALIRFLSAVGTARALQMRIACIVFARFVQVGSALAAHVCSGLVGRVSSSSPLNMRVSVSPYARI